MIEFDKLRKVPLWSIWLGEFRAWQRARAQRKEKYLIAIPSVWTIVGGVAYPSWFHLYETGGRVRSFEFHTGQLTYVKKEDFDGYHRAIVPWMHGKYTNQVISDWAKKTEKVPTKD